MLAWSTSNNQRNQAMGTRLNLVPSLYFWSLESYKELPSVLTFLFFSYYFYAFFFFLLPHESIGRLGASNAVFITCFSNCCFPMEPRHAAQGAWLLGLSFCPSDSVYFILNKALYSMIFFKHYNLLLKSILDIRFEIRSLKLVCYWGYKNSINFTAKWSCLVCYYVGIFLSL